MTFVEMMQKLLTGCRMRRPSWEPGEYWFLHQNFIMTRSLPIPHPINPDGAHTSATDWEECTDDAEKFLTIRNAVIALVEAAK